jgi:hypothetical protein
MHRSVLALFVIACHSPEAIEGSAAPLAEPAYTFLRLEGPARTGVYDGQGAWVATFTDGARTVRLRGPTRTFDESTAAAPVVTEDWVRLLPEPFAGAVDLDWLAAALVDDSPDALGIAMEYVRDAENDADYGPIIDGARREGADFHDYLGLDWTFPETGLREADDLEIRSLDCSGFARMVYGYRLGMKLSFVPIPGWLPRRTYQLYEAAPGTLVIEHRGARPQDLSPLQAGDLIFFDAEIEDGDRVDHTGIYLGVDASGRHRFISSRKSANGPTLGDTSGPSLLDGTSLYARSLRGARRL